MSATYTKGRLIARFLLYALLAFVILQFVQCYRVIRNERVCTRFSIRLTEGEHEIVMSLPHGWFQIQFTSEPNVTPSIMVSPNPVLPARISTKILRKDGSAIVQPTQKEYIVFFIENRDEFRPHRLLVSITKTNQCQIYMNSSSGF